MHSTDLFAALSELGEKFRLRPFLKNLVLRRLAHRQVEAHFEPRSDAFGTFALAGAGQVIQGWLVESRNPITRRVAFDESAIAEAIIAEPGRVFLSAHVAGYSGFEQMIVLFKTLCLQSHAGAWFFTTLELTEPLRDDAPIALHQSQKILNRLIVADLHQMGRPIGRVQMALSQAAGGMS